MDLACYIKFFNIYIYVYIYYVIVNKDKIQAGEN